MPAWQKRIKCYRRRRRNRNPSRKPARRELEGETHVPKMKSHKGAAKRIAVTGGGKAIRVKSWRGHHLELKSSRRTRSSESLKQVRRLLPYLGV